MRGGQSEGCCRNRPHCVWGVERGRGGVRRNKQKIAQKLPVGVTRREAVGRSRMENYYHLLSAP